MPDAASCVVWPPAREGHKHKSTNNRIAPRDRSQIERSSGPSWPSCACCPSCAAKRCERGEERLALPWQAVRQRQMPSCATKKRKQPPMASRSRRRQRPSSKGLGTATLLRPVPKSELLRNLESKFAVSEWLAKLLRKASIDLSIYTCTCRAHRA